MLVVKYSSPSVIKKNIILVFIEVSKSSILFSIASVKSLLFMVLLFDV